MVLKFSHFAFYISTRHRQTRFFFLRSNMMTIVRARACVFVNCEDSDRVMEIGCGKHESVPVPIYIRDEIPNKFGSLSHSPPLPILYSTYCLPHYLHLYSFRSFSFLLCFCILILHDIRANIYGCGFNHVWDENENAFDWEGHKICIRYLFSRSGGRYLYGCRVDTAYYTYLVSYGISICVDTL